MHQARTGPSANYAVEKLANPIPIVLSNGPPHKKKNITEETVKPVDSGANQHGQRMVSERNKKTLIL